MWQCFWSLEHLLVKDEVVTYVSDDINTKFPPDIHEDKSQHWNLNSLILPSFSATNSLVVTMDRMLTNIFPLPFVARPAISMSAVFTALDVVHKVNVTTAKSSLSILTEESDQEINVDENNTLKNPVLTGPVDPPSAWTTIVVLDLDLYSKVNNAVNSHSDLRNRYVLCLGELQLSLQVCELLVRPLIVLVWMMPE